MSAPPATPPSGAPPGEAPRTPGGGAAAGEAPTPPEERRALLRFLREAGALQFGEITLRSGRVSPYFFNAARFRTGAQLQRLGEHYAAAIARAAPRATIVFGPAYKGIPLCASAAMALSRATGREIGWLFNRKEAKTHGDAGLFVGQVPEAGDRLVMVDDVMTDGGTKREAVALLRERFDAPIDALVIAFNRMETDTDGADAVAHFQSLTGVPVVPLLTVADLETMLAAELAERTAAGGAPGGASPADDGLTPEVLEAIRAYRRRYGVAEP